MTPRQAVASTASILFLLLLPRPGSTADSGLITKPSNYSVSETVDRFENAVTATGQIVFGRVDHAAAAAKYGIDFKPHTTVLFGRPQNGTPLMGEGWHLYR
jgi:uncharacterized protein (DUF302 family)